MINAVKLPKRCKRSHDRYAIIFSRKKFVGGTMRLTSLYLSICILSACSNAQTVYVQVVEDRTDNASSVSKIPLRVAPKLPTPKSNMSSNPVVDNDQKLKSRAGSADVDPEDLASVAQYCEKRSQETVYMALNCRTVNEKNICNKSIQGKQRYLSEVKHCLSQFGWNAY